MKTPAAIMLALLSFAMTGIARANGPTTVPTTAPTTTRPLTPGAAVPARLPMQVDGPVTVSPWFTSAQPTPGAAQNHYLFAPLPPVYYGEYPAPWFGQFSRPMYINNRTTIINNYHRH